MKLLSLEVLRKKREERKGHSKTVSKRVENQLTKELRKMLDEYLAENDKVMIEINEEVMSEFIEILAEITIVYEYEQIDYNKFVFQDRVLKV